MVTILYGVLTPLLNEVTQILNTPNNILGIEYCKALLRLNSQIRPVTIRREGMGYHETTVPEGDSASSPLIYSHLLISLHLQLLYAVLFRIREVAIQRQAQT